MSWSYGYDEKWKRDIGYGVPATCDHVSCGRHIDRGLGHVCGSDPYGGDYGCGLYFCEEHLYLDTSGRTGPFGDRSIFLCSRCRVKDVPHEPTPDTREWMEHKMTDVSWADWRKEKPEEVHELQKVLYGGGA